MPSSITEKIEEILGDDRNFSTRTGLRFTLELIRDAFDYIETEKERSKKADEKTSTIEARLGHVETDLKGFLEKRKEEQKKAEDDRTFYRRAVISGLISIFLAQLALYFLR
jgi:hypothetical protein